MADPDIQEVLERPSLGFDAYGLAIHVAATRAAGPTGLDSSRRPAGDAGDEHALSSFERDMMSYAYRAQPPLRTRILHPEQPVLSVRFRSPWIYASEGTTYALCAPDAREGARTRTFRVCTARTDFARSSVAVLHIGLAPGSPERSTLTEFDLIKLSKLWEGGEGFPEIGSRDEKDDDRLIFTLGDRRLSFPDLVAALFGDDWVPVRTRVAHRVGTVSLGPPVAGGDALFDDARRLLADSDSLRLDPESDRAMRLLGLGGIVQALLDFREIEADELRDVFAPLHVTTTSILGVHKGTLISVERDPEPLRRYPFDVSPYLLVPHAVSLHNEERLRHAARILETVHRRSRRTRKRSALTGVVGLGSRYPLSISKTLDRIDEASATLGQIAPNIFHYPQERQLFDLTRNSRGWEQFERTVRDDLETAEREVGIRQQRRAARDVVVALVLTALGAVLAAAARESRIIPLTAIVVIWVTVIASYLAYRYRE